MTGKKTKLAFQLLPLLTIIFSAISIASAQTQVKGAISGRNGDAMTVKVGGTPDVTVLLTASTKVQETVGLFRHETVNATALVPGLYVQVKGTNNDQNQLVATEVRFNGGDLKAAVDSQAGLAPTQQAVAQNVAQIQQDQAKIAAQQQKIKDQEAQLAAVKAAQAEHDKEIAANKEAIAEANARFGELDQYNILGETTVLFANGKSEVEPEFRAQLLQLAQKAQGIKGYMIQVKGYASKVGGRALNQRLSMLRARNVTNVLEQQAGVPLTRMLSPGAMGTSVEVAPDTTEEGQAENRRVVVMILQNKGIAGP